MPTSDGKPAFLAKKIGGVALVIVGLFFTGLGFSDGSAKMIGIGIILLIGGGVLLALKIARRNEGIGGR